MTCKIGDRVRAKYGGLVMTVVFIKQGNSHPVECKWYSKKEGVYKKESFKEYWLEKSNRKLIKKTILIALIALGMVTFFTVARLVDLNLSQKISIIAMFVNGFAVYFLGYGILYPYVGPNAITDLEGFDPNTHKGKYLKKVALYYFIGIAFIVGGIIFQCFGIILLK